MRSYRLAGTHVFILIAILTFIVGSAYVVRGAVPPPPVNQFIGIADTIFQNPIEADCRACHNNGVPDRHHLLMSTTIPQPTSSPFGTPGSPFECLTCHAIDSSSGLYVFMVERNCLVCHIYNPDSRPSTPHHITQDSTDRHCSRCHGSVVQDFDDNHYIPDYDISAVTPDPACKTWNGPICVSGGCEVCHTEDATAVPVIAATNDLHHSAGFSCVVCHSVHTNIRDCEACHAPDSLHNIQADSDNPANLGTIVPGEENLGWGHIGNGWDCFGCHESFNGASTPQTGATIPSISGMSSDSVTAGTDTELFIYGSGFTNQTGIVSFESHVELDNGTSTITLGNNSISVNSIAVTIPSTLSPGLYDLRVIKDDKTSNKKRLAVIPPVAITNNTCSKKKNELTISGTGFGQKPAGTDEYINVQINGQKLDIIAWSDSRIKSSVSSCRAGETITVNALMGNATSSGSSKPDKPCRGRKCK